MKWQCMTAGPLIGSMTDSFILILHPDEADEAGQVIAEVRDEIKRVEGKYPISVSAGYNTLTDTNDSIQDCIIRADKKLYLDKERRR